MFHGAVREAVFSNPEVIRRVNAEFVPVAVIAALLHQRSDAEEAQLLRSINKRRGDEQERQLLHSIGRSAPAPQGLCVLNTDGQVLAWALAFDDQQSIFDFLDHGLGRFREHPEGKQAIITERYAKFPSQKMGEVISEAKAGPPGRHLTEKDCPVYSQQAEGTLTAQLIGRALDAGGKPVADTASQERYVQDHFEITPELQQTLAKLFAEAGANRVRIPTEFARQLVTYAYLGQIDVRPLSNPLGGRSDLKQCEFWAQKVGASDAPALIRVDGESEVLSELDRGGRGYRHEIKLTWEGFIEMKGREMERLLLSGLGTEQLKYVQEPALLHMAKKDEVAHLPAGRAIDMATRVRFGVTGEPIGADRERSGAASGSAPANFTPSIRGKVERLAQLAEPALCMQWRQEGKGANFKPIHLQMQQFEFLMEKEKFSEAEALLLEKFLQPLSQEERFTSVMKVMREFDARLSEANLKAAETSLDHAIALFGIEAEWEKKQINPDKTIVISFMEKKRKVQEGMARWRKEGRDPSRIAALMEKFEPLIKENELDEARALLDEALKLLGEPKERTLERSEKYASMKATTPNALKAEIEALKDSKVAWRGIEWKSCLLEGLKESREKRKPVLLWVFIDRPADDQRC